MLISVPAGACRTACEAALKEFENKRNEDRDTIESKSYQSLYDGAVHNGLKPTLEDIAKMREMATRDVEHMMESHPAQRAYHTGQALPAGCWTMHSMTPWRWTCRASS